MKNIFEERENIQPYEYPQLLKYTNAIWSAFWEPGHFTYARDKRDFEMDLPEYQKSIVERSMLAIGVVENKVKTFWARIDMRMPKTEISDAGHTFAGNEVVHRRTYEFLLNELGLSKKFEEVLTIPCMKGRVAYLTKYLKGINSRSNKEFTKSLILFVMLIENGSLFGQFLTLSSFGKYDNKLKNFSKVINATAREEVLHGKFGADLINIIKEENPEWFDVEMYDKIRRNVKKAFKAECDVLDWIFEKGELPWISKNEIKEFLKTRFNDSLEQIGMEPEYDVDESLLVTSEYMDTMLLSTKDFDFFDGKSTDYSQSKSFEDNDIWDNIDTSKYKKQK